MAGHIISTAISNKTIIFFILLRAISSLVAAQQPGRGQRGNVLSAESALQMVTPTQAGEGVDLYLRTLRPPDMAVLQRKHWHS